MASTIEFKAASVVPFKPDPETAQAVLDEVATLLIVDERTTARLVLHDLVKELLGRKG